MNNGTVIITDSSTEQTGRIKNAVGNQALRVSGGTVTLKKGTVSSSGVTMYVTGGGNFSIDGGTVESTGIGYGIFMCWPTADVAPSVTVNKKGSRSVKDTRQFPRQYGIPASRGTGTSYSPFAIGVHRTSNDPEPHTRGPRIVTFLRHLRIRFDQQLD